MIKKLAKAIFAAEWHDPSCAHSVGSAWKDYIPHAKACLEALREPSETMFVAAVSAIDDYSSASPASQYWRAMITAAMVEG